MATTQDQMSEVLRSLDRASAVLELNGKNPVTMSDVQMESLDTSDAIVRADLPVGQTLQPIDCKEKFARDFVDPHFTVKPVSYSVVKRASDFLFSLAFLAVFSWL